MNRWEQETTARIKRDELLRLLTTMTPAQQEAAHPEPASDPNADAVPRMFNGIDWDELLTAKLSMMVTPQPASPPGSRPRRETSRAKRPAQRPCSQVAALLPPREATRAPRATHAPQMARATTKTRSLAVADHKAPRTVAEVRERLDRGESPALWAASCELSPQVVAHLSAEEIAMLPEEIRLSLPESPDACDPPSVEVTLEPDDEVIELHAAPADPPCVEITLMLGDDVIELGADDLGVPGASTGSRRFATILASLAVSLVVGLCAVHFLV